ncbi:WD40-like Beta Propeller [Candidatus Vecturithrix granuli]|uniref:WD40-like Beta Propeller n=1 Tax=Vecturithrix granuli TaxID=1499967 RepID=A0A081C0J2_VECG1|nr:WD40-like Beta Propeller [Candidatus Vecturithrix granuli]
MRRLRNIFMILVGGICFFTLKTGEESITWAQAEVGSSHITQTLPGKIVFQAETDGDREIYAIQADGSHFVQLTDNAVADEYPRWSPDGEQIVFTSNRDGNYEIYVMDADGENQRRLTHRATDDKEPDWSPDGKQISFTSYSRPDEFHLAVMKADGTELRRILPNHEKGNWPAWSPVGNVIACAVTRYNLAWGLHLLNLDNTPLVRITGSGDMQPAWSPDGQRIAYVSRQNTSKPSIWVMNADGSAKRDMLTDKNVEALGPAWSPDGKYLVYAQSRDRRDPNWELAAISVEDQQPVKFAEYPLQGIAPDWHGGSISEDIFARKGIPWPLRIIYETEYAPHSTGKYRRDPEALNDRALVADKDSKQGLMSYDPYTIFPPGEYTVNFRIKASDYDKKETPLVRIDVATNRGRTQLEQQDLRGVDFQKKDRYQEFEIAFVLEEPQKLEFRVWFFATGTVWVDRITVTAKLSYHQ